VKTVTFFTGSRASAKAFEDSNAQDEREVVKANREKIRLAIEREKKTKRRKR
jgi:hypothetical protein